MNGNAVAQTSSAILTSGHHILLASCLLHFSGFTLGYLISRALRIDESSSRTVSIEVSMQNSSLGVLLAVQHFGSPMFFVGIPVDDKNKFGRRLDSFAKFLGCFVPKSLIFGSFFQLLVGIICD